MQRFKQLWNNLRSSFWFMPSLIVALSVVLAAGTIQLDSKWGDEWIERWPRLFGAGSDGAREMMSTIAGSMMTVVGVTFSMVLMVLALASSEYTSRILRNFMRSRVTQNVLGIFSGIFTYSLIVLRTIRGGDEGAFVPHMAVFFGFAMALFGVGALVYFIHHIASSIQASTIIASVAQETMRSIERMFPESLSAVPEESVRPDRLMQPLVDRQWHGVPAKLSGYIQCVGVTTLMELAREENLVVRMHRGVGEFVVEGTPLIFVASSADPGQELLDKLRGAIAISRHRTVDEDVGFGIRQIVDVALKALSPGINDTTTAITCLDYLTAILAQLATRRIPSPNRFEEGELRVIAKGPTFRELLGESFDQVRRNARGEIAVLMKVLSGIEILSSFATDGERRRDLFEQMTWLEDEAGRTVKAQHDLARFGTQLTQIREAIAADTVDSPRRLNHHG